MSQTTFAGGPVSARRVASLVAGFDRSPAYLGLATALQHLIGEGRIGLDVRLPSERDLTRELGVSRTTVTGAYAWLRDSGYAVARHGSGTYTRVPGGLRRVVDSSLLPYSGEADAIDLSCAAPTSPPGLGQVYAEAAEELPAYLGSHGYFPAGLPRLREAIARRYAERGLPTTPDQVLVTPGALSGTALAAQALLRPGERALVDDPVYPNAAQALRTRGLRLVPNVVDPEGWDLEATTATVRATRPAAAHLVPDFQNPTGHVMDEEQRARLAHALRSAGTLAVVDEAHCELVLDDVAMPTPFAAHARDAVTIGSASKAFWGGLRLGWIRAGAEHVDRLSASRMAMDLGTPVLEQLVLARLLEDDGALLAGNLDRLRTQRDALVEAMGEHLPGWSFHRPAGGLVLWCRLPAPRASALVAEAERHGVILAAGPTFSTQGGLQHFVRIPWTQPVDDLREAVRRIAAAWARTPEHEQPRSRAFVA